jgi:hypothetical protein
MKLSLNPPKKNTFWVAVIIAAVGVVLYAAHVVTWYFLKFPIQFLRPAAFLLVLAAFILLCLGLTRKGL